MIKQVAHIGIVVRDLDKAKDFYKSVLGLKPSATIEQSEFKASMVEVGDINLELLMPRSDTGTLAKFLAGHGEGIHHVCYEVDNIEAEIARLAGKGVELVDKKPRQGIEGMVAFLHPRSTYGVLTELVQKPPEK